MAIITEEDAPPSPSPITLPEVEQINVGTEANDGTGDTYRVAFGKVNTGLAQVLGALLACAPQAWQVTNIQTANYTASVGSFLIRMDATGGDLNVALPPASDVVGHCIEIAKWDSSGNSIFAVADGADTLYGTTGELTAQYAVLRLRAVADGWLKV